MKNTMFITVIIVITLLTVVVGGTVVGCTGVEKSAGPLDKVTIGISATSLLPALVHIAEEKGYFLEEGIDVDIRGYPTGKAALAATLDGDVDMGTVADTPIVFNSFERNDFAVFVTILGSAQHAKALARKDRNISAPQDLIGKRVGTTIGTSAHFFMATFLGMNRIDDSEVDIVDMKPGELVDAIANGDVDTIFAWEPNVLKSAKLLGDNAVLLPSEVWYMATFNLVSKNDFIDDNPELITRIIKALAKAEEFANSNRESSVDIMASRLNTDRDDVDKLWDDYRFKLSLSQSLLTTLEDEARWAISSNLTDRAEVPNYLDYMYLDALEEVKPQAVSIIR